MSIEKRQDLLYHFQIKNKRNKLCYVKKIEYSDKTKLSDRVGNYLPKLNNKMHIQTTILKKNKHNLFIPLVSKQDQIYFDIN